MASVEVYIAELMTEFGVTSQKARTDVSQKVVEVVKSLLSNNLGQFRGLEASQSISINTSTVEYALNTDFNTVRELYEVDTDGDFVAECMIRAKHEIHRRKAEGEYDGYRLCYVREKGHRYYLVLSEAASEATIFELDYYRKATADDADLIRKEEIVKNGVRGMMPQYCKDHAYYKEIYLRQADGFFEDPQRFNKSLILRPSRRMAKHNRRMYDIGKGG